jgi:hypothetical protein
MIAARELCSREPDRMSPVRERKSPVRNRRSPVRDFSMDFEVEQAGG